MTKDKFSQLPAGDRHSEGADTKSVFHATAAELERFEVWPPHQAVT